MNFEWDERKAHKNERKHRISFDETAEVFGDDYSSSASDPDHSEEEERFLLFGVSENWEILRYLAHRDRGRNPRNFGPPHDA